jgi:hypothetical protein
MEELDEFGIPIKKTNVKKPIVDEFGIPVKKKDGTNVPSSSSTTQKPTSDSAMQSKDGSLVTPKMRSLKPGEKIYTDKNIPTETPIPKLAPLPKNFDKLQVKEEVKVKAKELFDEINTVDENVAIANLEDAKNDAQPIDYMREGGKKFVNVLSGIGNIFPKGLKALTGGAVDIGEFDTFKPYVPLQEEKEQIKKANPKIQYSQEELQSLAEKLFVEKDLDKQRAKKANDLLQNVDPNIQRIAKSELIKKLDLKNPQLEGNIAQINVIDNTYEEALQELKTLEENVYKLRDIAEKDPTQVENYNQSIDIFNQKINDLKTLEKDYTKLIDQNEVLSSDVNDLEKNIELFKLNYNPYDKFLGRIASSGMKLGAGAMALTSEVLPNSPSNFALKVELGETAKSVLEDAEKIEGKYRRITLDDVQSAADLGRFSVDMLAEQLPVLASVATGYGGLAFVGAGSGGQKTMQMRKELENNPLKYTDSKIALTGLSYALAEAIPELQTLKIMNGAKRSLASISQNTAQRELFQNGMKKSFQDLFERSAKVTKNATFEGLSENATGIMQDYIDEKILGNKPTDKQKKRKEEFISGFIMGGGMTTIGEAPAFTSYVLSQVSSQKEMNEVSDKLKKLTIFSRELEKENLTESDKKTIQQEIKSITKDIDNTIKSKIKNVESLSKEQIEEVVKITTRQSDLKTEAQEVKSGNLSDNIKKFKLEQLKQEFQLLEEKRNGIKEGSITTVEVLPISDQDKLKREALKELKQELNPDGKKDITITDSQITERANKLYINQQNAKTEIPIAKTEQKVEVQEQPKNIEQAEEIVAKEPTAVVEEVAPKNEILEAEDMVAPSVQENQKTEEIEPIGQLGTGANIYFQTEKYRVNDLSNGKFVLNIGDKNEVWPIANVEFDNAKEAVQIAEKLNKLRPEGLTKDYNIDGVIENLRNEIKNETQPTESNPADGNISTGDNVVESNGIAEQQNNQAGDVQNANDGNAGKREVELDINEVEGFLNEEFGDKKPVKTPKQEVKKEEVPNSVGVAEVKKESTPVKQAKGFASMAVDNLTTSLKDFQGRAKEYSEQTYNRIVDEAKQGKLNISSIPPIQIWKNPQTGKFVILAGHSRTKAFSDLASGKVEFSDKYKKSDFENINSQIVEAETLEEAQKIAQESNQGAVQTVVDNAKYVRESLLPTFKNFNQAKTKLKSLYGSAWARIYAYANLNPKGKAMQMLKQFQDSNESDSDDKSKKIAEWTGKSRSDFENLTDAHENEIFDYLLKNDKIKTYSELSELLNRRVNGLEEFNTNEPLNFEQKIGRGSNEVEIVKQIQDLKNRDIQIKKQIKELQSFGKNINESQRKQIKELTAESIKINTVDIPNAQVKQKQARAADAEQFDIFSQINEQIENGNITPEQVDKFVNDDRKAEEIEPIVKAIESKAKSENKVELEEAVAEVEEFLATEENKKSEYKFSNSPSLKNAQAVDSSVLPITLKATENILKNEGNWDKAIIGDVKNLGNGWFEVGKTVKGESVLYSPTTDKAATIVDSENKGGRNAVYVNDFVKNNPTISEKQQRKNLANAEVDKIAQKVKDLLPGIKDPDVKKQGLSQDAIIDLVASAVKNLVSSGIEIDEAIKQVVSSLKERFGDLGFEIDPNKVKSILNPPTNDSNFNDFEKAVKSIPISGIIKKYLSGETIEEVYGTPENPQEYDSKILYDLGRHGEEVITKAKEIFGLDYIEKSLEALDSSNLNSFEKAIQYVALMNEVDLRLQNNPNNITDKKLQKLIYAKYQKNARIGSLTINAGRLMNIMKNGIDVNKQAEKLFSSKQKEAKNEIEKIVQVTPDGINKVMDSESVDIEKAIEEGVEKRITELYSRLPTARRIKADKAIKALEKIQKRLRSKTYDATIGVPIAIIDSGISVIKNSIKAGVNIADAIEAGINHIKEKYGKDWEKESQFRQDMFDGFSEEGIDTSKVEKSNKDAVKELLIEAGFSREVKSKGEVKTLFDWKKLAGEEGSVDKIKENVENVLKSKNYSKNQIEDASKEFESEYNRLSEEIINKGLAELENRNLIKPSPNRKIEAKRLAELFNYGLMEGDSVQYDNIMNKVLGLSDLDAESYQKIKNATKALADIFNAKRTQGRLTEGAVSSLTNQVNHNIKTILHDQAFRNASKRYKTANIASEFAGLAQKSLLENPGNALENILSGVYASVVARSAGALKKELTPEMRKQNSINAKVIFDDINTNAGLFYGDTNTSLITQSRIEEWLNGKSDNRLYHAILSFLTGRVYLQASDSMAKSDITNSYFAKNVIEILTHKSNPEGPMTAEEALLYISDNTTGIKFDEAVVEAKKIIDEINGKQTEKQIADNPQAVHRFAMDIVRDNLISGGRMTKDQVEKAYIAGYKSAGRDIGHVANNWVSASVNYLNSNIQTMLENSIKEKEWDRATLLTLTSIITKNIMNPFVGGGTNWIVRNSTKAGIANPLSAINLISDYAMRKPIDLSTETGRKHLEEALYRKANFQSTAATSLVGTTIALMTFALMKYGDDEEENLLTINEWLKKNEWAKKYFDKLSPETATVMIAMENEELGDHYIKSLGMKTDYFDQNMILLRSLDKENQSSVGIGASIATSPFSMPGPWRMYRDVQNMKRGLNGIPPIKSEPRITSFWNGVFKGGFIDYIGLRPDAIYGTKEELEEAKKQRKKDEKGEVYKPSRPTGF